MSTSAREHVAERMDEVARMAKDSKLDIRSQWTDRDWEADCLHDLAMIHDEVESFQKWMRGEEQ